MPSRFQDDRFDIREHQLDEAEFSPEPDSREVLPEQQKVLSRRQRRNIRRGKSKGSNPNYGWAFFLASFFIGLGITATTHEPMGLFGGLGIGFLFFVDPIYQRVMQLFR